MKKLNDQLVQMIVENAPAGLTISVSKGVYLEDGNYDFSFAMELNGIELTKECSTNNSLRNRTNSGGKYSTQISVTKCPTDNSLWNPPYPYDKYSSQVSVTMGSTVKDIPHYVLFSNPKFAELTSLMYDVEIETMRTYAV